METAAACRRLGIQPILYLTVVVEPASHRANLLLDNVLGAEIHTVPILPCETEEDADVRAPIVPTCAWISPSGSPATSSPARRPPGPFACWPAPGACSWIPSTHTGKALAALLADVRSGKIAKGEYVLFWHTGGATALFAEPEILGKRY